MRLLTAVALWLVLLLASPALAQGDGLDSDSQTQGYGRMMAYVCGAISVIIVIVGAAHVIKGFLAELERGRKVNALEKVLDDLPKKKRALYLGEKVPEWKVTNRQEATRAALKFLSAKDDGFSRKQLVVVADEAFRVVKAGLEERSAKAIERRVTPDCLEELRTEIKRLRKKGERHVFGDVEVTDVQVVHLEAPAGKDKHTFTALIAAKSRDCVEDDRTGKLLRGDRKTYAYLEFWRFRRTKGRWLVERIRPSADMDTVLNAKNVLSPSDLDAFAKDAEPDHVREFVAK